MASRRRQVFLVGAAVVMCYASAGAQHLSMGSLGTPTGFFGPGLVTVIDSSFPASGDGMVTSATFQWSAAPCPAAVKIKIFSFLSFFYTEVWNLQGERGPFDVQLLTQTVALTPPVAVRRGDLIAITSLSSCGEPARGKGPEIGYSVVTQGDAPSFGCDVRFCCCPSEEVGSHPLVRATDDTLSLLKNRFLVTLSATDPRTGKSTIGHGVSQGDRWGFFALPEFTGDPDFPEVIVKMADATLSPPPFGGSFWFFYSSLTDVQYTLTVTDQASGRTRSYSNVASLPGQLCGGADTNAFQP